MQIGDYVRLVHGIEEGYIVKVVDDHNLEIETLDGFVIPVLKKDVVVVDLQENELLSIENDQNQKKEKFVSGEDKEKEGIFIGAIVESDLRQIYLINNTDDDILYVMLKKTGQLSFSGMSKGELKARKFNLMGKFQGKGSPVPQDIHLQIIKYPSKELKGLPEAKSLFIQLRKSINIQKNEELPLIHAAGKLIELEDDHHDQSIEVEGDRTENRSPMLVDLHAEVFIPALERLTKEEILSQQLERFRTFVNSAIVAGHSQITFIHGVGEGTLRTKIINESNIFPQISSYHYADQSSFGTGATTFQIANR